MRTGSLFLSGLLMAAAAGPAWGQAADIEAVEAVVAAEIQSIIDGDVAANMALLTDDAVIMPPGDVAYVGQGAEAFFQAFLEAVEISEARYLSHDITIYGDVAIDDYRGQLTMTPAGSEETVTDTFKGIHILERQADGSWLISYDIWNSDNPDSDM